MGRESGLQNGGPSLLSYDELRECYRLGIVTIVFADHVNSKLIGNSKSSMSPFS